MTKDNGDDLAQDGFPYNLKVPMKSPMTSPIAALVERLRGEPMEIGYTNHRGEYAKRRVKPIVVWFGSTPWHPEPQWFLKATDLDKDEARDFALKDISAVDPATAPRETETTAEERARFKLCGRIDDHRIMPVLLDIDRLSAQLAEAEARADVATFVAAVGRGKVRVDEAAIDRLSAQLAEAEEGWSDACETAKQHRDEAYIAREALTAEKAAREAAEAEVARLNNLRGVWVNATADAETARETAEARVSVLEMALTEEALAGEIADTLQICRIPASRDAVGEYLSNDKLREIGQDAAQAVCARAALRRDPPTSGEK